MDRFYYHRVLLRYPELQRISSFSSGVKCDPRLLKLDYGKDYDIINGYGTLQEWDKYRQELLDIFKFKEDTINEGDRIWKQQILPLCKENTQTCSIHYRRTDYLLMSSLCLSDQYYIEALKQFKKEDTLFVVFSDDIEYAKEVDYLKGLNVVYMENSTAIVDMYLMSRCDHNLIANSSFSFWGAYLNKNRKKRVVCPHDYIGASAPEVMYMNGNWYPSDWIALNVK